MPNGFDNDVFDHAWDFATAIEIAVDRARARGFKQRIRVKRGTDDYGDYRFEITNG